MLFSVGPAFFLFLGPLALCLACGFPLGAACGILGTKEKIRYSWYARGREVGPMKLLYAEDEAAMSEAVVDILTYHNYMVDPVYDGEEALAYAQSGHYDGIILDIMMPKLDGLEVLRRLRAEGCRTPILLLTAKAEVEDQVQGLDLGADDYLPKPFSMDLLLARVRAMLRRREEFTPTVLPCGNITLNQQTFRLSKLEYRLMEVLILNKGIYLSTEDLLTKVWGYDTDAELGTVWVYLSYLRKRLTALHANVAITAKRGVGYTLEVRE